MIKWFACLLGALGSTPIFASVPISSFIALSAGPAWYQAGQTQTIDLQPDFANTYAALNRSGSLFDGELFFGFKQDASKFIRTQLGLALSLTNSAQLQGHVWETADPQFDNFQYQYRIKHQHIALKGKWSLLSKYSILPYCSVSMGIARNTAYHYTQTPLIYEALANPGFRSQTVSAFNYNLGLGVDKSLDSHWIIGMGYQFSALGKSQLGRAPQQTINEGLLLSNLYAQELQITISYLI